jgi:hypothetical protein
MAVAIKIHHVNPEPSRFAAAGRLRRLFERFFDFTDHRSSG